MKKKNKNLNTLKSQHTKMQLSNNQDNFQTLPKLKCRYDSVLCQTDNESLLWLLTVLPHSIDWNLSQILVFSFRGFSVFSKNLNTSKELSVPVMSGSLLYNIKFIAHMWVWRTEMILNRIKKFKKIKGTLKLFLLFKIRTNNDLSLSHDVKQFMIFQKLWGRQHNSITVPDFARNTDDVRCVM